MSNENILYQGEQHWAVFIFPAMIIAVGFFIAIRMPKISPLDNYFLAGGIIIAIINFISFLQTRLIISDQKLILQKQYLTKIRHKIALNQIEGTELKRTTLGRILGYGTLVLTIAGGRQFTFNLIKSPRTVQQHIDVAIATFCGQHQA